RRHLRRADPRHVRPGAATATSGVQGGAGLEGPREESLPEVAGRSEVLNVPTYRIVTLGCKLNQADSAALEARLRSLGLRRAPVDEAGASGADLVVLNTCTVTANAD